MGTIHVQIDAFSERVGLGGLDVHLHHEGVGGIVEGTCFSIIGINLRNCLKS